MNEALLTRRAGPPAALPALARFARRMLLRRLGLLRVGRLRIVDGAARHDFGEVTAAFPFEVTLTVHSPRFWSEVLRGGSIGAGESYARGDWSTSDLVTLVRILVRNPQLGAGLERGPARLRNFAARLLHAFRRNTRAGSRRNIAAHYDLGDDFFGLFLDPTMMYSCALFEDGVTNLEQASRLKLERICDKLELGPGDELLEIGSGWGALALRAAERGCRVWTTTISRRQYEFTRRLVRERGLDERVTVLSNDYRDLHRLGRRFDKVVSIEMLEAVGHRYFDLYFRVCSELLRPEGMMLVQTIVIDDRHYDAYRRSTDFIQRHIFPGGCLPAVSALATSIARATDLRLFHLDDITPHYATTLQHWRQRFLARREQVRALGLSDEFVRLWEFYLCYSEGAFHERSIGDVQLLLTKPLNRRRPLQLAADSGARA